MWDSQDEQRRYGKAGRMQLHNGQRLKQACAAPGTGFEGSLKPLELRRRRVLRAASFRDSTSIGEEPDTSSASGAWLDLHHPQLTV